jgi:cell division FtsZ-interacting protein ZapD
MKGLSTKGVRELEVLRKRVKRVYGVGRITYEQLEGILQDLDSVERKLLGTATYGEPVEGAESSVLPSGEEPSDERT